MKQGTGAKILSLLLAFCMILSCLITFAGCGMFKKELSLYVSPDGDDSAVGNADAPFATLEGARDAIRKLDKSKYKGISVIIRDGDYNVSNLTFTAEDGGTEDCPITYAAEHAGKAVLNGGVTLNPADFTLVTDAAVSARLSDDAREQVRVIDLGKMGITSDDYGKIYTIGTSTTASYYDGDWVGPQYAELFFNNQRMSIARYPNEGWLSTGNIAQAGDSYYTGDDPTYRETDKTWANRRNHKPYVYEISQELTDRLSGWKTFDDVWMYGYWFYDWADASSPVGDFDPEANQLSPKFVSYHGAKVGAPYYFFNVFEELDAPGEWYLDRENALLYLYADADTDFDSADISLSLSCDNIITVDKADWLTFDGLVVKGTRGDAIETTGNHNTVKNCCITSVGGNALIMTGYENLASRNEITRTGQGGILLNGGDSETLTPGNNIAENNLIHDWSEVQLTHHPGVMLTGIGNICRHNEMFNSPHHAIDFEGNNHVIEYNYIHECVLLSNDAGAIYSGRHWDWYGTVIRYNYIAHLGDEKHTPNGIYLDDALSGITVYGNLLVDIPNHCMFLGGGRDIDIRNNIFVMDKNTTSAKAPLRYDARAYDGLNGDWYGDVREGANGMWENLQNSPWQTDVWQKAYPQMARIKLDPDATEDPDFPALPSYSTVSGNLICSRNDYNISPYVEKYGTVENNPKYDPDRVDFNTLFVDPEAENFHLIAGCDVYTQLPDFEDLPIEEMGIQPEEAKK